MSIGNKLAVVKNAATSKAGLTLLRTQKHSPSILFVAGVVGFGATVVLASRATLKLNEILEENEKRQFALDDEHQIDRLTDVDAADKKYKKESAALKIVFVKDVARLYAPCVATGVLSVGALTGSHVILNRRYASAVAAYATLDRSFKEYRGRVTELYGAEVDKKLVNGVASREIINEDGTIVSTIDESRGRSPYSKLFAKDTTYEWSPQPDYNLHYLRAKQQWANDQLNAKGVVFLNDVYKDLGFEPTSAGQIVGWVKNNKRGGDNFIDFGIFDNPDRFNDFMAGREGAIWLDFNVDGVVYDLI
jgi:hypothetical protein